MRYERLTRYLFLACIIALMVASPSLAQSGAKNPSPNKQEAAALADILADPDARERLIGELRSIAEPADKGSTESSDQARSGGAEAPKAKAATMSWPRRIAAASQGIAENATAQGMQILATLRSVGAGERGLDWSAAADAGVTLVLVVVVTVVAFFMLRRVVMPLFDRLSIWAGAGGERLALLRRTLAVLSGVAIDFGALLLAWLGGYASALLVFGSNGDITTAESLFLNAFVVLEAVKVALRLIMAPRNPGLRLLPVQDATAGTIYRHLAIISSFAGYGMLVAVPLLKANALPAMGLLGATVIMALAFAYVLVIVLKNRKPVRARLSQRATRTRSSFTAVLLTLAARTWHIALLVYAAVVASLVVSRPEAALPLLATITIKTLLAIGGGVFVAVAITQFIGRQIQLPETSRNRFPHLEKRLNAYIPLALSVVRVVIVLAVVAILLDTWGIFDLGTWLSSEAGALWLGRLISVAFVITATALVWIGVTSWIENRLSPHTGKGEPSSRERTLLSLLANAVAITLVVLALMISLSELGLDIGPLLAGAGVLGLAIGFGAQKLVQDIITGVFIQLENAINTGDVVTAAGVVGVAERLSIRSVGLRDLSGTFHVVPFSSVDVVSNYMREFAYHVGDYGVAYREDTDEVITYLRAAFADLRADPENSSQILDDIEVFGVNAFEDSAVVVRIRIKTLPGSQWSVGRAYNRLVKRHFDAAGIELPFPHTTLYFGQDKNGEAPAGNLRVLTRGEAQQETPDTPAASEVDNPSEPAAESARTNPKYKGDFEDS